MICMLGVFLCRGYEAEYRKTLSKKEHPLRILYPPLLWIGKKVRCKSSKPVNSSMETSLKQLYVNDSFSVVKQSYTLKKVSSAVAIFLSLVVLILLMDVTKDSDFSLMKGNQLVRSKDNQEYVVPIDTIITDEKTKDSFHTTLHVSVSPVYGKEQEKKELCSFARGKIEEVLLDENESKKSIISSLKFVTQIPEKQLRLKWNTGDEQVIDTNGQVNNRVIETSKLVPIQAEIYQVKEGTQEEIHMGTYQTSVQVIADCILQKGTYIEQLNEEIGKANEDSKKKDTLLLPTQFDGKEITYQEKPKPSSSYVGMFFGAIVLALFSYVAYDETLKKQLEKRNKQLMLDYPNILNKFTLLIGAGMTLTGAWNKIVSDYEQLRNEKAEKKPDKRYAYEEMIRSRKELELGISEQEVFENFGRRVGIGSYLKFTTLLTQNLKKGTSGLTTLLEAEAIQSFEDRKSFAKKLGEEASTKLLFPMLLMLLIVMALIMVPAVSAFRM